MGVTFQKKKTMDETLTVVLHSFHTLVSEYAAYLNFAHIVLTLGTCKKEWIQKHTRMNPAACFFLSLVTCTAGGVITAVLTGNKPIIDVLLFGHSDYATMTLFTVCWYLTFYCPGDFFNTIFAAPGTSHTLYIMKEALRCKKIWYGVKLANTLQPEHPIFLSILLGTISSCGSGFIVNLGRFITNRPYNGQVLLSTTFQTQISAVLAILYTFLPGYFHIIYLVQFSWVVCYKLHLLPVDALLGNIINLPGYALFELSKPAEEESKPKETKKTK